MHLVHNSLKISNIKSKINFFTIKRKYNLSKGRFYAFSPGREYNTTSGAEKGPETGKKTAKAGKIADDPPELSGIRENSLYLQRYENRTK